MNVNVEKLFSKFNVNANYLSKNQFGSGHINDTFLISAEENGISRNYVLQRINSNVFKMPWQVMENIFSVTGFIERKLKMTQKDTSRLVMHFKYGKDGKKFVIDEKGDYWRMYDYIYDAVSLDLPESKEDFYNSAVAFGDFQRLLSDFPADTLYESIEMFHNTPKRYNDFLNSVKKDVKKRAADVKDEIEFFKSRESFYSILEDNFKSGKLPLRVTHNDTKINNVMLDKVTRKPLCVIDLDTVMPGYSVNDFGDSIRFGATTAAEDERDLSKVHFDYSLYEIYLKGFLKGCDGNLTDTEIMLLPIGAIMMTAECGMRFLADYLDGDVYFKTDYEDHNLVRCRTQIRLIEEMEACLDKLTELSKANIK